MARSIGFGDFTTDWEGPVALEFKLYKKHTEVMRYLCELETRTFDLYVPLFMIDELSPNAVPETLVTVIGKTAGPLRTIGFSSVPLELLAESDVCEYDFAESMVNSEKYVLSVDGTRYSLYVPNEIFAGEDRPARLFLRIALPAS